MRMLITFAECINVFFIVRCESCVLLDCTLTRIKSLIELNRNISDEIRIRLLKSFNLQFDLVQEWKKHQIRAVHQETARDFVLKQLDEKSVRTYFICSDVIHR